MQKIKLVLIFSSFILWHLHIFAQGVVINEAVTSNSIFQDEDNDTPDWFEIHNQGDEVISLAGWQVTDDEDASADQRWTFPNISLAPNDYLVVWASDKDRKSVGLPRTLISRGDDWRYVIPTASTPNNWRNGNFDDANWSSGASGIGYGDGDDATFIGQGTRSVFMRKSFQLSDQSLISRLILDIDFDDAFVAYINGIEVARSNVNGNPPAYNATANTDHEAQIYEGGLPDRFDISNAISLLKKGENVLSIQVHNINNSSSDFSIIPFLTAFYSQPSTDGTPPPNILNFQKRGPHTDFKLSSKGETIYLFDADNIEQSRLETSPLPPDISTGLGENSEVRIFATPTPGGPNVGPSFQGVIATEIQFSHPGGDVSQLVLTLTGVESPERIRYTTDGREPSETSAAYGGPIPITQNAVVRARVFREGFLPSRIQTKTYLVDVAHNLPIVSLVTAPDNLFDEDNGIYVEGDMASSDFPHFGANFWEDWERPIHFSLFEKNGANAFSFDAGVKVFGGWSRGFDQRSLSIFARSKYGVNEIKYPLFPDKKYDEYQALVLRNSGNDWINTMMRDGLMSGLMSDQLESQAYRPVATYINGEYWGMYNMREKINEHFIASRHDVNPEEINLLEFEGQTIHGTNEEFITLRSFIENNNLTSNEHYAYVADRIDIDNFILYHLAQIYFDNTDWPGNNIKYWNAPGRKWRWILFDTDFGFDRWNLNAVNNNTLAFALQSNGPNWPNPPWSTLFMRKLTQNLTFRNKFVNQFADELNSRFLSSNVTARIDSLAGQIAGEMNAHMTRWGGWPAGWAGEISDLRAFASGRTFRVQQHIRSQFNLSGIHPVRIENEQTDRGFVQLNSLKIESGSWSGDYFQGVPISLTAVPKPGFKFVRWENGNISSEASILVDVLQPITFTPIFEAGEVPKPIVINEINYQSGDDLDTGDWIELYNPNESTIDISNYVFKDSDDEHVFIFPAQTSIAGGAFLVAAKDRDKFMAIRSDVTTVVGDFDFGLSGEEDMVRIYDPVMQLIDSVQYTNIDPWPNTANATGNTIELIRPELDNALGQNWSSINTNGTPGATNQESTKTLDTNEIYDISLWPNPGVDRLKVSFISPRSSVMQVNILDVTGRVLYSLFDGQVTAGPQSLDVDLSDLSAGMYFIELKDQRGKKVLEWIKL